MRIKTREEVEAAKGVPIYKMELRTGFCVRSGIGQNINYRFYFLLKICVSCFT